AAVRPGGIRALAGRRVAGARVVALVLRGADDGVRPGAGPGLAGVAAGARVVVVAAGRVRRVDAAGHGGAGIVRARVAVVAVRRWTTDASPARARVARGASVPVVAASRVRRADAAGRRVAGVVGTRVAVIAAERRTRADPIRAHVPRRTGIPVVAHGAGGQGSPGDAGAR